MSATLTIPKFFRRYLGDQDSVTLTGDSVGDGLRELCQRFPNFHERIFDQHGQVFHHLVIFRNQSQIQRQDIDSEPLNDGDELDLVGAVVGGSGKHKSPRDVRMRGFQHRVSYHQALAVALDVKPSNTEQLKACEARGRVLAGDVQSDVDIPAFRRSAMDGYAIHAQDSFGASHYNPLPLDIIAELRPGQEYSGSLKTGQAIRIMTGSAVPDGATAVLKAEDAEQQGQSVMVQAAIQEGKNIGRIGEDIQKGQTLLRTGRVLRPQDIGVLVSIGQAQVKVRRKVRVALLITGNELLKPGAKPSGAQIVDSNSPMLSALIERDGGLVTAVRHLPDDPELLKQALKNEDCDVIIASGGTSVGAEDYLPLLLDELGELPIHGIALRPAAPTGIGRIGDTKVFLMPGNPVSCLCAYDFFAGPCLRKMAGLSTQWPYPMSRRVLAQKISSQIGRLDYVRAALNDCGEVVPIAISGASALSSTTRADGFVVTPEASEGLDQGQAVDFYHYDQSAAFSPSTPHLTARSQ